jgi:hypothetical protein
MTMKKNEGFSYYELRVTYDDQNGINDKLDDRIRRCVGRAEVQSVYDARWDMRHIGFHFFPTELKEAKEAENRLIGKFIDKGKVIRIQIYRM